VGQSTSLGINTSLGWGNYNGAFVSFRTNAWKGLTAVSNLTWGRSLGTSQLAQYNSSSTPLTIFDLGASYGLQNFDIKFIYNLSMYYAEPFYRAQHGILGHLLGGWTISPLFTAQSGGGTAAGWSAGNCTGCEAFGEVTTPGTSAVSSTSEEAVGFMPYTGSIAAHYGVVGSTGCNITFGCNGVGTKVSTPYLQAFQSGGDLRRAPPLCVGLRHELRRLLQPARPTDLGPRHHRGEGRGRLQGARGGDAVLHLHQHPEPLPAEWPEPQPDQPDFVRRNHRPGQYSALDGVRHPDTLLIAVYKTLPVWNRGPGAIRRFGPRFSFGVHCRSSGYCRRFR